MGNFGLVLYSRKMLMGPSDDTHIQKNCNECLYFMNSRVFPCPCSGSGGKLCV